MKILTLLAFFLSILTSVASSQSSLSDTILKRIADATPKPLPQSPVASKLKSDADDERLRGWIKRIVKEREYLSPTASYAGRRFRSTTDFDERGNRVKAVYFGDNGNPYEVSVFGYLDGTRASKYQTIYEDSGIFTGGGPPSSAPRRPSDPRYSYKYEYKYVGGRLSEMQLFLSNGEKWMRYVYNYHGNQMEELAFGDNGKLNQKYITVFDTKGYEIEWRMIAVINLPSPDRNYLIRNETFDKEGNWTKRTFLKLVTDNGTINHEPGWTEYRTIAYYSGNKK